MTNHNVQDIRRDVPVLSSDSLTGTAVKNARGEDLGHIEELMLDINNGRIAYAVLSFGGILGIGDKLFAVPWNALQVDTHNEKIILDVSKERLEEAPGFDKDDWPHTAAHSWLSDVYDYYGHNYYGHTNGGQRQDVR
jgi:sporulation protein YlmC with PRC-barrel domain